MQNPVPAPQLMDLQRSVEHPAMRALFRRVEQPLEELRSFQSVLRALHVEYTLSEEDRAKVPTSGPVVIVANQPFGSIEGLILGDLLTHARPDVRLMGSHLFGNVPESRRWSIPLKACEAWLEGGGALGVFPSATVSHLRLREGQVSDPPWSPRIAALIRRTGATVLPVFFEGRNSALFQLASLIHPELRSALLLSECLKHSHSKVGVRIGRPIRPEKLARYEDDETLIHYLRFKTYLLQRRESPVRPRFLPRFRPQPATVMEPLCEPIPPETLTAEIARLPREALLAEHGDSQVFVATAPQIPSVLREIGRLREKTFREVSEGTGRAIDLDSYDETYLHLFMWNQAKAELVGSYRIGQADEALARGGARALYTSSLFKFDEGFLQRLGPALELGRSFIRAEYQRKPTSLALIWRGIGEYLVRHPRYKVLFGPVSISRDYHSLSRRIMVEFLAQECGDARLAGLVKARRPLKGRMARDERDVLGSLVRDVEDISALVSEIEEDNKDMPVLLRHYLRLNARLLSFSVDPDFGDCIDGLVVVDLRTTDPKILKRFMGDEGYQRFSAAP
ncbi:lysophospholipid acyltransferase family protein [Pyxidicoccus parkwayensis]|uniref:Lysophospholipid acyltransferase family protein n=1 Tax=Pyxidicoccus parkwayensis TaxID=2813578 RepID=A0ABX7P9G4_9BACT|nr:GNAT family N-acyltransferase [Pyxidicoccus parkwaysis]QSQ27057.1 lysophospholipid acyltransferase family protein [Pyxidicoccus parkwaysis]